MNKHTQSFVEITADMSHVVVADDNVMFICVHAMTMSVDGHILARVTDAGHRWVWQSTQRTPISLLTVIFPDGIQYVTIERMLGLNARELVTQLYTELRKVDARLCVGQSAWITLHINLVPFESALGMTVIAWLRQLLNLLGTTDRGVLRVWDGEPTYYLRPDYIAVHDARAIPLQKIQAHAPDGDVYRSHLATILTVLHEIVEYEQLRVVEECTQAVMRPMRLHPALMRHIDLAMHALTSAQGRAPRGYIHETANIALLYERWVWVTVLQALGCTTQDIQTGITHGYTTRMQSRHNVWCGYQRRLMQVPSITGWSRDERVAIPDIMMWYTHDGNTYHALIIDAKFSLLHERPSNDAMNDCTAYLRRIGVGQADPDGVVLVHPGNGYHEWPSGLVMVGSDGIDGTRLHRAVAMWCEKRLT